MSVSSGPIVGPIVSNPRVTRPLRGLDIAAIETIAAAEKEAAPDQIRLMLSFATFKWRPGWRGELGEDTHSVKLLSGGIDAVKQLADRENLPWDVMAGQLIAFAVAEWEPGWRKNNPGDVGSGGIDKNGPAKVKAGHFDHARFGELLKDQNKL